jgi:putative toxin-antitoxin system antitoxin component (TIGR02293 family)
MAVGGTDHVALRQDEIDGRVQRVVRHALEVFEDEAAASEWLHDPNPALEDRVPIELARTEEGARSVHVILGRIEHGVYS